MGSTLVVRDTPGAAALGQPGLPSRAAVEAFGRVLHPTSRAAPNNAGADSRTPAKASIGLLRRWRVEVDESDERSATVGIKEFVFAGSVAPLDPTAARAAFGGEHVAE